MRPLRCVVCDVGPVAGRLASSCCAAASLSCPLVIPVTSTSPDPAKLAAGSVATRFPTSTVTACTTPAGLAQILHMADHLAACVGNRHAGRSEEHTSELQSLMRNSYAVFGFTKKNILS